MRKLVKHVALVVLMLLQCRGQDAIRRPGWEEFKSSTGFRVAYPMAWFRIGASKDRLRILSSEGGAEGIVIKRGQAEIMVVELDGLPSATLSQLIDEDTREEAAILLRRDIHNGHAQKGSCINLKEVVSEQDAVPPNDVPTHVPYIINTDFYCEINGRKFSTLLKNWQGDKQQEQYRRAALEIAKSLRLNE
jgi:hypothetical protein